MRGDGRRHQGAGLTLSYCTSCPRAKLLPSACFAITRAWTVKPPMLCRQPPTHLQRGQDGHCVLPRRQVHKHIVQRRPQLGGLAAQHIPVVRHQHGCGAKGARLVHLAALQTGADTAWLMCKPLSGLGRRAGAADCNPASTPLDQTAAEQHPCSRPTPPTSTHHPPSRPPGWASCARHRTHTASPTASSHAVWNTPSCTLRHMWAHEASQPLGMHGVVTRLAPTNTCSRFTTTTATPNCNPSPHLRFSTQQCLPDPSRKPQSARHCRLPSQHAPLSEVPHRAGVCDSSSGTPMAPNKDRDESWLSGGGRPPGNCTLLGLFDSAQMRVACLSIHEAGGARWRHQQGRNWQAAADLNVDRAAGIM